ncbi:hypothetical protein B0H63DRAFT_537761 [Podospora didyma]|uniref:Glucose-methanol-choline oxidoreductase C-terminal domain-containing protein n=1 Tax=Podospora didyma TaxID=330526 RepID=A0AAE0NXT5_9PEZI|nr:hypothetical protein B0H63DRAFT_537761 [Podospora didyma]
MEASHPLFSSDSQAACVRLTDGPLSADAADIEYSAEDDAVLEKWVQENVQSTWHSLGTCKMLPREEKGPVDASLNLSIVPRNVAASTNSTALAIGKKAADIFTRELSSMWW